MSSNSGTKLLKTLSRSSEIIETIRELDGAGVNELADRLGMASSTVHSHLVTLENLDLLIKQDDTYQIGLRFLDLGGYACHRRPEFMLAKEKVEELAEETEERVQYIVEEHGRGIYLSTTTGANAVQVNARIGKQTKLHASAAGKAILAQYSREHVQDILDRHPPVKLTENTITNLDNLFEELSKIRDRGYSFNRGESIRGLYAIGVPIKNRDADVVGALSISAPRNRMTGAHYEVELPNLLLGAANELELNLAFA